MTSFSPDDVKAQLKLILASPEFSSSQRISQFLGYVVMQTLKGQSGVIKQYTIAVEGMGFGAGFDPQPPWTEFDSSARLSGRTRRNAIRGTTQGRIGDVKRGLKTKIKFKLEI